MNTALIPPTIVILIGVIIATYWLSVKMMIKIYQMKALADEGFTAKWLFIYIRCNDPEVEVKAKSHLQAQSPEQQRQTSNKAAVEAIQQIRSNRFTRLYSTPFFWMWKLIHL